MKRHHYTREVKEKLLFRYASEQTDAQDLLQEAGIPKSTFNQWLREYDKQHNCQSENDYSPRYFRHLKARNLHLADIIAVLNDSYCSPRAPLRERLNEAERLQGSYNIHLVCEALGLSRGTFYNHIKRNHRDRAWFFLRREELKKQIRELFDDSSQIYGARKMAAVLRKRGVVVSTRLVHELMAELGLISVRVYSNYLYSKEFIIFYNEQRPHEKLNYQTPNEVEASYIQSIMTEPGGSVC